MKRVLLIAISAFCFLSCTIKQTFFDECILQCILEEDPEFLPFSSGLLFYCQTDSNRILLLYDVGELREIYNEGSFNMDYKTFLTKALNQQIVFSVRKKGDVLFI